LRNAGLEHKIRPLFSVECAGKVGPMIVGEIEVERQRFFASMLMKLTPLSLSLSLSLFSFCATYLRVVCEYPQIQNP